ncbi:MAG: Ykof family thiamine-binding protein [bacterium]|nr:Ykof family thiamine-binding protein [bacterium]
MRVQAEVSWYPLKALDVTREIQAFVDALRATGVEVELGALSALVRGDSEAVFDALKTAFHARAQSGTVVMLVKYVNL